MKVVIIGGVAAGAGAAARLRRLDETTEIVLLERGPYISYANCGLPYHLGGLIPDRSSLLVVPTEMFKARFNVDVRTGSLVTAIDAKGKSVTVCAGETTYTEPYDRLLIATGSTPLMPDLRGLDAERVFQFWTIPDLDKILKNVGNGAQRALVVGAGFIGLEAAENLRHRGLAVTVVDLVPQVLPPLDPEMSAYAELELADTGIDFKLGRKVVAFEDSPEYRAVLDDGTKIPADLVLMCIGVRPNSELAVEAGLKVGTRGHILVDNRLRTSDPNIYAAGDAVEMINPVIGSGAIALAGPANKQGRIAADNIAGGDAKYPGSLGASVIKTGEITVACVGLSERSIKQQKIPYRKIYTHPGNSAAYYPGGTMLHIKLMFGEDGRILGAQVVGAKGVDKRIDVVSAAMASGRTVYDLADLELSYSPPYNSAKDPVNFLGMIAEDLRDGLTDLLYPEDLTPDLLLLDIREPGEFASGTIPGAINIPLGVLRSHLSALDKGRKIALFCRVGLRGYTAERILKQNGFVCANLSGGFLTWQMAKFGSRKN